MPSHWSRKPFVPRVGSIADVADGDRRELIEGILYEVPLTSPEHRHIADSIVKAVRPFYQLGENGPGGWYIEGEGEFEFDGKEVFRPDALGWRKDRLPRKQKKGKRVGVVPDWVCEVLSPATRGHDLKVKGEAYARIGVAHRWYIDPEARTFYAFKLMNGGWVQSGVFCDDDFICAEPFHIMGISMEDWWGEPSNAASLEMTPLQGRLLAFIHAYVNLHQRPPAEHEICSRLSLTPPSVHNAIVRMERAGLIARTPGQARSIRILVPERDIPKLDEGTR